jgi:CRP-like cAMP-binding protein
MGYTSQQRIILYIEQFVKLSIDDHQDVIERFKEVKVKKRQFIVQPGFVSKKRYFVIEGALRGYVIGDEGQDHTIQLATENWWISDYNSYMFQQPATMFVMALEDCILLQISHDDELFLKSSSHQLETFFRVIAERAAAFMQRRLIINLTQSAEERYSSFLEQYPQMMQRIPQYAIASYLGMTTEFLSKIAVFLASEDSYWVTGELIAVSGGQR